MQANGVPAGSVALNANQAAVVSAIERIMQGLAMEIQQLDQLWGQKAEAAKLTKLTSQLMSQRDEFLKGVSRLVVAPALPAGLVMP